MKPIYSYTKGKTPIYLDKINGVQRILLIFQDSGRLYVYYCDDYLRHTYLNRINKSSLNSEPITIKDLVRIDSDEEFYFYTKWIENNYNYNGVHVEEKIDGHDLGGAVLIDSNGQPLIK